MRGTQLSDQPAPASIGTDRVPHPPSAVRTPCADANPDLWFAERPAELNVAKALCAHCPIKAACLAGALERGEPWGVWGGEIVQQGVVLAYKRGRGRPSNADRQLGLVTKVADPNADGASDIVEAAARRADRAARVSAERRRARRRVTVVPGGADGTGRPTVSVHGPAAAHSFAS